MLQWPTFFTPTEMLPVERVVADWERSAKLAPLYSLASLYKHAEACPASTVTRRSNLCKHKRSSTSLTTFILNWAHFFQPIDEIYQTAHTPPSPLILAPVLGASVSRVILADPGFLHVADPPKTLAKALVTVSLSPSLSLSLSPSLSLSLSHPPTHKQSILKGTFLCLCNRMSATCPHKHSPKSDVIKTHVILYAPSQLGAPALSEKIWNKVLPSKEVSSHSLPESCRFTRTLEGRAIVFNDNMAIHRSVEVVTTLTRRTCWHFFQKVFFSQFFDDFCILSQRDRFVRKTSKFTLYG